MNVSGLIIGISTFIIIGIFHPIVVKAEYYFSARVWPLFLVLGIGFIICSALLENIVFSGILGVLGFTCLWSIKELFEQVKRVEKGWAKKNPKRKNK